MGCSASTVTSGGRGGSSRGQILLFGRISPTIPEAVSPPLAGLAHLVGRATGQSLTGGNRIEPLVDGEQAYPAMLAAIESARYSVALTSYIFDSQGIGAQFVDALRRAHERGVQVRVLIDDVYARWTPAAPTAPCSAPAFRRRRSTRH